MSLVELADHSKTDKNTVHSYLPLYQQLFNSKKQTAKNVLEVGIYLGGSIKLWHDFFTNATVHGLDISPLSKMWPEICNKERIILYTSTDAYNTVFFTQNFLNKDVKYDILLDDGPHTLESMIKFIQLYSQLIADDGILVIEDVPTWEWIEILTKIVPEHLQPFIKVYDLREIKHRFDDLVFTIDKTNV
jgi:hypothetical protein